MVCDEMIVSVVRKEFKATVKIGKSTMKTMTRPRRSRSHLRFSLIIRVLPSDGFLLLTHHDCGEHHQENQCEERDSRAQSDIIASERVAIRKKDQVFRGTRGTALRQQKGG